MTAAELAEARERIATFDREIPGWRQELRELRTAQLLALALDELALLEQEANDFRRQLTRGVPCTTP